MKITSYSILSTHNSRILKSEIKNKKHKKEKKRLLTLFYHTKLTIFLREHKNKR